MVHSLFICVSIKSGCAAAFVYLCCPQAEGPARSARLDLLDIDLIALLQPGLAAAAMRAGLAVLYGRIGLLAVVCQTARATEIAHQMQATIAAAEQQMLRSLSPKQIAALEDTLRTIYADLG